MVLFPYVELACLLKQFPFAHICERCANQRLILGPIESSVANTFHCMNLHVCLLAARPGGHRRKWLCGRINIATKRLKVMTHRYPLKWALSNNCVFILPIATALGVLAHRGLALLGRNQKKKVSSQFGRIGSLFVNELFFTTKARIP